MKKHSEEPPDWHSQRDRIIGLGESSIRKSYYPELQQKMAELEKKNKDLQAAYEELSSSEEELRQNYEELSAKERELRESEEKYRNLIENTFDGVVIHRNQKIVFANRTAARLFGSTDLEAMIGRPILEIVHPDYHAIAVERATRALETPQLPRHEKFLHSDKTTFDVEVVATPILWEGLPAVQVAFRDITGQKRAEEALQASEIFYRTLFETTGTATIIIDEDTTVSRANEKYAELLGYSREEIEGKRSWTEFVAPEDLERMKKYHSERRVTPLNVPQVYEFRLINRNDRIYHCLCTVSMIPGTKQSIASVIDITERVSAQQELERTNRELHVSETRFRQVAESAGEWIWEVDGNGLYTYASPIVEKILGYSPEDLVGKKYYYDLFAPEIREQLETGTRNAFRRRDVFRNLVNPNIHKNGSRVILETSGTPVIGEAGQLLGYRGTDMDITERKRGEDELQKVTTELQLILKSMINAFVIWESVFDENGRYVSFRFGYFNDSYARISNVNLEEVKGRDVFEVWPDTEKSWVEVYGEVAVTGVPKTFEMYHAPTRGTYHCNAYRPQDAPDRICVIFEDITERKRAEEERQRNYEELIRKERELQKAKTFLEAIYEGSPDLIFVHSADGRLIDVNENVLKAFGISREEAIHANPDEMSGRGGYTREMAMGYIRTALDTGKADFEWVSRRKNGDEFPTEVRLRRLESLNDNGVIEHRILASAREITERKMTEKALDQARKKLGLLNTVVFQDIQSTIFALAAYLQLANNNREEAKAKSFAEKEAFLIHKIVSSLNFARNYQDMGVHPPRWQNVNQVFLYAISHLDSLNVARTVKLDNLEIYADPLLEKVFFNMIENIFLHGQRVTEISLVYRVTGDGLMIILNDNGAGIPAEEKQKIFERGYGKNTGLGLFMVREVLSITGISIRETGIEGEGAQFEILVPKGVYRFSPTQ